MSNGLPMRASVIFPGVFTCCGGNDAKLRWADGGGQRKTRGRRAGHGRTGRRTEFDADDMRLTVLLVNTSGMRDIIVRGHTAVSKLMCRT